MSNKVRFEDITYLSDDSDIQERKENTQVIWKGKNLCGSVTEQRIAIWVTRVGIKNDLRIHAGNRDIIFLLGQLVCMYISTYI